MKKINLESCPKAYTRDLDKAKNPEETINNVYHKLENFPGQIVAGTRRIDKGRLNIPVYIGICGAAAREIMPTRKQMGKGSSPAQAEASALMELMERYAFFSFWHDNADTVQATFSEAEKRFGSDLISVEEILRSVNDNIETDKAREILDLTSWQFYPATNLKTGKIAWLPLDWFRMLGEFNGSSAGNTNEESLLQGLSELIERHVSALVSKKEQTLPTIDPESCNDPVLRQLIQSFKDQKINLVLKDISMGMPLPTVAALAWDPATFPESSEIVFTAGTASSPTKAAIRAITEVAQLGGDFCTSSCYEASGLPKFQSLDQFEWLLTGPLVQLDTLPSVENNDIYEELKQAINGLAPLNIYGVETTNSMIDIPAHYTIVPGLEFRERDANQCLGLFVGRKLAQDTEPALAEKGLKTLMNILPDAHYLPFFQGLLAMRQGHIDQAIPLFDKAVPLQPDNEARAMACFYLAYAHSQLQNWQQAIPALLQAVNLAPQMKEYINLLGVAYFKTGEFQKAEACFNDVLSIDRGSAMDLANRGMCRLRLDRKEEARKDLKAALELDPSLDFAREHLQRL